MTGWSETMWPSRQVMMRVAVFGDVALVRDEQHRDAALAVQPLEDAHDLDAGARVEVAGRLVGQQDRRLRHERAGDRDALLLPARELVRVVIGAVGQPDRRQALHRQLAPLGRASLPPPYSSGSSTLSSAVVRESRLNPWKTNPIFLLRTVGELILRHLRHVLAVEDVLAGRRPIQTAQDVHQRRLAGAGRPGHGQELAGLHFERHAAQRADLDFADDVRLDEVSDRDDRRQSSALTRISARRSDRACAAFCAG